MFQVRHTVETVHATEMKIPGVVKMIAELLVVQINAQVGTGNNALTMELYAAQEILFSDNIIAKQIMIGENVHHLTIISVNNKEAITAQMMVEHINGDNAHMDVNQVYVNLVEMMVKHVHLQPHQQKNVVLELVIHLVNAAQNLV